MAYYNANVELRSVSASGANWFDVRSGSGVLDALDTTVTLKASKDSGVYYCTRIIGSVVVPAFSGTIKRVQLFFWANSRTGTGTNVVDVVNGVDDWSEIGDDTYLDMLDSTTRYEILNSTPVGQYVQLDLDLPVLPAISPSRRLNFCFRSRLDYVGTNSPSSVNQTVIDNDTHPAYLRIQTNDGWTAPPTISALPEVKFTQEKVEIGLSIQNLGIGAERVTAGFQIYDRHMYTDYNELPRIRPLPRSATSFNHAFSGGDLITSTPYWVSWYLDGTTDPDETTSTTRLKHINRLLVPFKLYTYRMYAVSAPLAEDQAEYEEATEESTTTAYTDWIELETPGEDQCHWAEITGIVDTGYHWDITARLHKIGDLQANWIYIDNETGHIGSSGSGDWPDEYEFTLHVSKAYAGYDSSVFFARVHTVIPNQGATGGYVMGYADGDYAAPEPVITQGRIGAIRHLYRKKYYQEKLVLGGYEVQANLPATYREINLDKQILVKLSKLPEYKQPREMDWGSLSTPTIISLPQSTANQVVDTILEDLFKDLQ